MREREREFQCVSSIFSGDSEIVYFLSVERVLRPNYVYLYMLCMYVSEYDSQQLISGLTFELVNEKHHVKTSLFVLAGIQRRSKSNTYRFALTR